MTPEIDASSIPVCDRISPGNRRGIFICILLACIVSTSLNTILNTVLPAIMGELNISSDTAQWLSSGYTLAMAITMPLTAFLAGRFPTKPLFVSALAVFCLGIGLSAFATDFPTLMAGRIIQACGNGVIASLAQVVLLTVYPTSEHGKVMGWYGLSQSAAPTIAPTIGGIVADMWGWRYIFYAAFVIGALTLLGAGVLFKSVLKTHKKAFDTVSFALSALIFGGITLGVGNFSSLGIGSPATFVPLLVGLASLPFFVRRQLKSSEPFLDLRVLSSRPFLKAAIGSILLYFVMMGGTILAPLFVQQIVGESAAVAGLVMLPGSLLMTLMSPIVGRIYDNLGIKALLIAGGAILAASCVAMAFIGADRMGVWALAGLFTVRSAAIACLLMPLVTWGVGTLSEEKRPHGTALLSSLYMSAGAIGSAVSVGLMNTAGVAAESALAGFHMAFALLSILAIPLVVMGIGKIAK